MRFLSHRGYWLEPGERNAESAFVRSFERGFGTETDVRDLDGRLVVSHDPPRAGALPLERVLELHARLGPELPLALNVKSDGLEELLGALLERHAVRDAFVFDMSVPDTLRYVRRRLRFFTRHSEHEPTPALYEAAAGVWLDACEGDWARGEDVAAHLRRGKQVCLVSPELHGREPAARWRRIGAWLADGTVDAASEDLMLCTDRPDDARAAVEEGSRA